MDGNISSTGLLGLEVTLKEPFASAGFPAGEFTEIPESLATEIDALGMLEADYKAAKKTVAEYDLKLKMLSEQIEQHTTGKEVLRARGEHFAAELPVPSQTRFVSDIREVVRLIGATVFLEHAKFNVGDVENLLPPDKQAAVLGFKDGTRKLKLTKI